MRSDFKLWCTYFARPPPPHRWSRMARDESAANFYLTMFKKWCERTCVCFWSASEKILIQRQLRSRVIHTSAYNNTLFLLGLKALVTHTQSYPFPLTAIHCVRPCVLCCVEMLHVDGRHHTHTHTWSAEECQPENGWLWFIDDRAVAKYYFTQ